MNRVVLGLALGLIIVLTGCRDSSSDGKTESRTEQSILGVYENSVDKVGVELKADGKAVLLDDNTRFETKWERDGADRIIIYGAEGMRLMYKFNSDGNLSDDMGLGSVLRKK